MVCAYVSSGLVLSWFPVNCAFQPNLPRRKNKRERTMFLIRLKIETILKLAAVLILAFPAVCSASTVRMQTVLGNIDIELFDAVAPLTVTNFMNYVNSGAYNNSFIHRSVPGFVVQGGGYTWDNTGVNPIAQNAPVMNEFSSTRSNVRGTIAMAKLGSGPDTATNQWFFNLADNSANLDFQNGGFTVFGQVIGNGMQVVDAIAALSVWNATGGNPGSPFGNLPLVGYTGGAITGANLAMVTNVAAVPVPAAAWLLGSGLIGLVGVARMRRKSS
jgi:cyclophilin family peptidyl-prolyl cis-trans isomerase